MGRFRDGFRGYPARGCAPNVNYPRTLAVPTDARLLTETVRRARTNLPHCADGARKAGVFSKFENELRCFSNGIGVKHFKKSAQARIFGHISGRISQLSRASCVRMYTERKIPACRVPSLCRRCAPPLPETVRRALLLHVSAGSVGFADARRPRHDRDDAAFARRRALPPLRIRQPSADCGFYLAIIRKRTTYTGAFFVVLRCSSAAVAHSDCPLAARLLHRFRHCRRFARHPQGEDTPFPKEKSGPEIFTSRFSYSVYRFRQIPNPGR
mgnify:FL=1